jgi:hypothetical protein
MLKYHVEYDLDGSLEWDGSEDGIVHSRGIAYRIPEDAEVCEVVPDGYYLNHVSGVLFKRNTTENGYAIWRWFDKDSGKWEVVYANEHENELEWLKGSDFERIA